jgi:hypothetical protein
MLLFAQDYARFPSAIIDYNTRNESFKRLVALYNKMGIKNCLFPLVLLQPELQGIDPHDPDLSVDVKAMIGIECRYNPWYFFREVVRIPAVAGPVPIPFRANRGNIALIWSFFCNIDIALIQPRQTGKSVSTDTLMVYLLMIGASNTMISMLTKDDKLRKANVERIKKIRDLLPPFLVPKTKKDTDNQDEVTCVFYNNRYTTGVAQSAETAANNLGRGLTSPVAHIDEGPFISWIGVTLPAMLASGTAARAEAKRYGKPHGSIFTTTAGKRDDRDGRYMYDMIANGADWTEAFFDAADRDAAENMVRLSCNARKDDDGNELPVKTIINATFSHRQLGLTDEWLAKAMADANSSGDAADRDFFNVWTSGTQRSPLSIKLNEMIRNSEMEPLHQEITREGYIIKWYIPAEEMEYRMSSGQFVLGMDTSEAVGRDAIAGIITDLSDLSTVGSFIINETNLIRFARCIADIMIKYKKITLIPERKSTGQMLIDSLLLHLPLAGEDPFKRIYNSIVDQATANPDDYKAICTDLGRRSSQFYDSRKRYFGFNTTAQTRDLLYGSVLQNAANRAGMLVRDKRLSKELRGLVEKNGRIDHITSGHDDAVIAWMLNNWFITQAKNLKHYGIDVTQVDTIKPVNGMMPDPEFAAEQLEQQVITQEIKEILAEMETCDDDFWLMKLEFRLKALNSRLILNDEELFSIDALIKQSAERRGERARTAARQHESIDTTNMWQRLRRRF